MKHVVCAIVFASALGWIGCQSERQAKNREIGIREACMHQLRNLWYQANSYRGDYGEFPSSFDDFHLPKPTLDCPAVHPSRTGRTDYIYVGWLARKYISDRNFEKYPIIFDRRMSNHKGRGINIVTVDGTVFWDADAAWLKSFARDHPEAKIPLPDEN